MNTADVHLHHDAVLLLMFQDGFGIDEVLAHLGDYSSDLFGSDTPTGRLRVRTVVMRIRAQALASCHAAR